jgi:hypothetical protein
MSEPHDDIERHVGAFRRLLTHARDFRDRLEGGNNLAGAANESLVLLGEIRDLHLASGLSDLSMLVFEAEGLNRREGSGWTEAAADGAHVLGATSRILMAIGPAFMPASASALMSADLALMSVGDPSLLAAEIPRGGRAERPTMLENVKACATRYAHFHAGRLGSNWKAEFLCLRTVSDGTLKTWNRSVSATERAACQRVGKLVGKGLRLTSEDEAVREQATRYGENILRVGLASLLEGGSFDPLENDLPRA